MLFDLSSPGRKNVVRVVFGFLALLFASSFIFLGIGTEGGFNPLESIFGGGDGSTSDAFEQQIDQAEEDVDNAPGEAAPLAELALLRVQSGEAQLDVDQTTGIPSLTDASRTEFEEAISVWQEYLDADPQKVNVATANRIVLAYRYLEDAQGAIAAQEALTESQPTGANYAALAELHYITLDLKSGDEARDKAIAESKPDVAEGYEKRFEGLREQVVKAKKQQAEQPDAPSGGGSELENPFGGLSPADPGAGLTPAP